MAEQAQASELAAIASKLSPDALAALLETARTAAAQESAAAVMAKVLVLMAEDAPVGRYSVIVTADRKVSWSFSPGPGRAATGARHGAIGAIRVVRAIRPEYEPTVGRIFQRTGAVHPAIHVLELIEPALAEDIKASSSKLHNLPNYTKVRFTYEPV